MAGGIRGTPKSYYTQPPTKPYDPYGYAWGQLSNPDYWQADMPTNYYNQFENYFGNYWGGMQPYGQYNVGQAGVGMYNSDLLGLTEGEITQNLTDPNAGIAMGLAKDQIRGAGMAAQQGLANQLAATGRGGTFATAIQAQQGRDIAKTESEQYRNIALQTQEKAVQEAMQFEAMRGGFYNDAMARQLQNASLALDAWKTGQITYNDYLQAQKEALKTYAGMAQFATQAEMGAESQTYQNLLALQGVESPMKREAYDAKKQYEKEMWGYNMPDYYAPYSYGNPKSAYPKYPGYPGLSGRGRTF